MPEDFIITPESAPFDVVRLRAWLDARIDAYEDPFKPGMFLLNGIPSELHLQRRLSGETRRGALVFVSRDQVDVVQAVWADTHATRSAMDFVVWLTSQYACRICVEHYGNDMTEQLRRDGVESLYEHYVPTTPHLWDSKLVRVGFYWEIHGLDLPNGLSLEKARRPEPDPDVDNIVRYLESGRLYEKHDEIAIDYFDPDFERTIGPSNVLTDGFYIWPADFAFYVRTYHVHVPRAFVMHAKRNGWQVPEVDVASLPELAI